jgi:hypothetical protein
MSWLGAGPSFVRRHGRPQAMEEIPTAARTLA